MKLTSSRAEDRVRAQYAQSTAMDVLDQSPAMEWVLSGLGFVLLLIGLAQRSRAGLTLTLIGGALVYGPARKRVNSALRDTLESRQPKAVVVDRAVTILRSRSELYADWHEFQSLPRIVPILKTVTPTGERRSHWVAEGPRGQTLEWDVEITYDDPNELIRWQALPGAPIPNRGEVRFNPAPADRDTEVRLRVEFDAPIATVDRLLGPGAGNLLRESARNFKRLMEAGEIPTNDPQPMGTCVKR